LIRKCLAGFLFLLSSLAMGAAMEPEVAFQEDTVCSGESALLVVAAGPKAIVQWIKDGRVIFMGDSLHTPPLTNSTTYKVSYKVKDKAEPEVAFLTATVENSDQLSTKLLPRASFSTGQSIEFKVESDFRLDSCIWNFGDGQRDTLPFPSHVYEHPGRYEAAVHIKTTKGCSFLISTIVVVEQPPYVDFPSAFSPNGDGYNDTLRIAYYDLKNFSLKIYDRKGYLMYETENPDFFWDGIDIYGEAAEEGVYTCKVFAVTTDDKEIRKQLTLTLIR